MGDVAAWAKHFRVYAVDMIGEPGLSASTRPSLRTDAYALWLDDVMKALAIQRAPMVGVSLGGWLALDYATRRVEFADRVVVLCPAGVGRQRNRLPLFSDEALRRLTMPLLAIVGRWWDAQINDSCGGARAPKEERATGSSARFSTCARMRSINAASSMLAMTGSRPPEADLDPCRADATLPRKRAQPWCKIPPRRARASRRTLAG